MSKYHIAEYNCAITDVVVNISYEISSDENDKIGHFVSATWVGGQNLTEDEIIWLNNKYSWLAEELCYEKSVV